jgi:hypothetical protein
MSRKMQVQVVVTSNHDLVGIVVGSGGNNRQINFAN